MTAPKPIKLARRQEEFCHRYAASRNASQSYKIAYRDQEPSLASCRTGGSRLLKKDNIRKRIEQLTAEATLDAHIKPVMILNEYADLAFCNLADMVDDNYNLKPLKKLSRGQKKAIRKLKKTTNRRYSKEGDLIGETETVEVELHDRMKALDSLAQYTGILKPEIMQQIFMQVNNQNVEGDIKLNPDEIPVEVLEQLLSNNELKTKTEIIEHEDENRNSEDETRRG